MVAHPYHPTDIVLPDFVPVSWSMLEILGLFAVASIVVLSASWFLSKRIHHLSHVDRSIFCWWAFTGLVHFVIEGAFVVSPNFVSVPASETNFLIEVWKEYSKGDSRYATRDSFIVSLEFVTAFVEGPACFLAMFALATRKPYRHTLQLMVSMGQLYGDILYFGTCYLEGFIHSAPGVLYFWFYFVAMNAIWVIVPALIIVRTFLLSLEAVKVADKHKKQL